MAITATAASKISGVIKNISSNPLELTAKAAGVLTAGSVVYDAHSSGLSKAKSTDRVETADRYDSNFKQYMTMEKKSQTVADLKKRWFRMQQSFQFYHITSKITGYLNGASNIVLDNLPELGLSALAVATRKFKGIGIAAGALLCLNGAKTFLHDIVGIGRD